MTCFCLLSEAGDFAFVEGCGGAAELIDPVFCHEGFWLKSYNSVFLIHPSTPICCLNQQPHSLQLSPYDVSILLIHKAAVDKPYTTMITAAAIVIAACLEYLLPSNKLCTYPLQGVFHSG